MIQVQRLTGMRPGEVCVMRGIDIDMTGSVWLYRPGSDRGPEGDHKTAWHGHERVIAVGPQAQSILRPLLKTDVAAYLFAPKCPYAAHRRKRRIGQRYTTASYNRAIRRAVERANRQAVEESKPEMPRWHAHQLRHACATAIRRAAGLDAARVTLGHRSPQISETYAALDIGQAAEVMLKIG
jgi:integrase